MPYTRLNSRHVAAIAASVALLFASPVLAIQGVKTFEKTVSLENGGRLSLEMYKGSLQLRPWDKNEVRIEARIEAPDNVSRRYAEDAIEATDIWVTGSGSSVRIVTDYEKVRSKRSWFSWNSTSLPYVHYKISAPKELDFRLEDHKSEHDIEGFSGKFFLETYKGTLHASALSGEIVIDTYKGRVRLDNIRGSVETDTYKGDVAVTLSALNGKSVFDTHKGEIRLIMPESQGFDLMADLGERTHFRSDYDLPSNRRRRDDVRIETSINGGGPRVVLRSEKGTIRLQK